MKKFLLLLLTLVCSLYIRADKTLDSLLNVLDQTMLKHEMYVEQREARIRNLKELAEATADHSMEEYALNNRIYQEYKAFICDSAIHYLNKNIELAGTLQDGVRKTKAQLQLSLLLSSIGMTIELIIYRSQVGYIFAGCSYIYIAWYVLSYSERASIV